MPRAGWRGSEPLRTTEQHPAPFRPHPLKASAVTLPETCDGSLSHLTTAHHLRRPRRGRQTSPGQGRVWLVQDNRWPRLRLVHALVRQRIRQELALWVGADPGRARSPTWGEAGGPGGPDRWLSGHATRPFVRQGPDPPGPTRARARPPRQTARMTGGGSGRAGCANGGLPGAGPGARAGRCGGPALSSSGERAGSSAPGPAGVRRARAGLEGLTGLRCPSRASPTGGSPQSCLGLPLTNDPA